jgi:hypothetical protein
MVELAQVAQEIPQVLVQAKEILEVAEAVVHLHFREVAAAVRVLLVEMGLGQLLERGVLGRNLA